MQFRVFLTVAASATLSLTTVAQDGAGPDTEVADERPVIVVDGIPFMTWAEYTSSDLFREKNLRCGNRHHNGAGGFDLMTDCDYRSTNPRPQWDPTYIIQIPVVVHVIEDSTGRGHISRAKVWSQIDILNEDFRALPGTNGANGTDTMVQFYLANVDPDGNATNGINRAVNDQWFNDNGSYWNSLAWDPNRYLNIYTNEASGALGYVPFLPQSGPVGSNSDRVVVLWSSFGRDGPIGPPYDQGRTTTHEVGHYLGLWHTFDNGCGGGNCYGSGDYICDTNAESSSTFGCPGNKTSCGSPDPIDNYMDYSDDLCMEQFTPEQTNRMRCTLANWRPNLECDEGLITTRTGGGPNYDTAFTSQNPYIGQTMTAKINMTGTGYASALLLGYSAPANITLGNGQVMLVDPSSVRVLSLLEPGPKANYAFNIPSLPSLCGATLYCQGMLLGGANPTFGLTNAQDWTIGL